MSRNKMFFGIVIASLLIFGVLLSVDAEQCTKGKRGIKENLINQ
ncbi:MAG: hypothetical protein QMD06_03575 [Candidatus Altarchaeum sp.]|nr:hypothetical protein [Candidatus Altarchaeum sp.]